MRIENRPLVELPPYRANAKSTTPCRWLTWRRASASSALCSRSLDSQREKGKGLFGSGFLISEKAAAEKAAAEKAEKWQLSDREKAIVASLG